MENLKYQFWLRIWWRHFGRFEISTWCMFGIPFVALFSPFRVVNMMFCNVWVKVGNIPKLRVEFFGVSTWVRSVVPWLVLSCCTLADRLVPYVWYYTIVRWCSMIFYGYFLCCCSVSVGVVSWMTEWFYVSHNFFFDMLFMDFPCDMWVGEPTYHRTPHSWCGTITTAPMATSVGRNCIVHLLRINYIPSSSIGKVLFTVYIYIAFIKILSNPRI